MKNVCLNLKDRSVIAVGASAAKEFLQGILTCNMEQISEGHGGFSGLLTPQGKILFDFFVVMRGDDYLLDVNADMADDLLRRLTFYRLRADVSLEKIDPLQVFAVWGGDEKPAFDGIVIKDPRHEKMGWRVYGEFAPPKVDAGNIEDYQAHRIVLGVPEGGVDYEYGKAFPHEALYDQIGGVDFAKGCYVGQEVISRVHHRGTARKRVIVVHGEQALPPIGSIVSAGGKAVGEIRSSAGANGLALLRLDRVGEALGAGHELIADGMPVRAEIQAWVNFDWPNA